MPNPVSLSDLVARYRPLSPDEATVASALLADAWAIITHQVKGVEARLADATLAPELVTAIECAMVLRVLRNPDGKRAETIDDYSYTRDDSRSGGLLYLGPDEAEVLAGADDSGLAFTITPVGAPGYAVSLPLNYWELNL